MAEKIIEINPGMTEDIRENARKDARKLRKEMPVSGISFQHKFMLLHSYFFM
jgi:hypothetical protein